MISARHSYLLLSTVLLSAACGNEATAPGIEPPQMVRAAKPPSIPTISLVVTVSNTDDLGNSYNIRNDGQGVYTDGLQGVAATLDQYGTFAFNTAPLTGKKSAIRWVSYDFNDPVDPANTYRPSPSNLKNHHFSTGPSQFSPFIPIQNLGVNGNPASECVYMGNNIANNTTAWRVSYHKGLEDVSDSQSAYAVVTRTSVSPAVWTITPTGSCSAVSNVAELRSGDGSVLYGYYNLPFLFTLTVK